MNIALHKPQMTRAQFFAWAEAQDTRYEFDGFQPVAMTGGSVNHSVMTNNIHRALYARLKGSGCRPLGPDAGVATVDDAVRYPDALVTCTRVTGTARTVEGVVVVFEVLSPTSGRTDRIVKLREYRAVPSIRRYVILEHASIGLTVFARADGDAAWTATALTAEDTLPMPEIGIEIPVAEFYEDVDLADASTQDTATGDGAAAKT
ncbi:MAG: Uma2 family endonuclease [Rhodospirillales bacterium]|nr:Uma2 family endonuclease [Rhodospirillales bacterium]